MAGPSKLQLVGQIQSPGNRPQNVTFIGDEKPVLTRAERAAGIQWVDGRYKSGDVRRYGENTVPGTTDMTAAIQSALNSGASVVVIPEGTFLVDPTSTQNGSPKRGLQVQSNTEVRMSPGTRLVMNVTTDPTYNMLCVYNKQNVTIVGGVIVGDNATHIDTGPGHNGIGIRIQGSDNVFVYNTRVEECYADGIAVIYDDLNSPYPECTNVHLINCSCVNNHRNGASLIGVIGGSIIGGTYDQNTGTTPRAGIDIEPNANKPAASGPSFVNNFLVSGVSADSNFQGIVCDAAGTVDGLVINGCIATNNTFGILVNAAINSSVTNNVAHTNATADFLIYGSDTIFDDGNSTDSPGANVASSINKGVQGLQISASGIFSGVKVFDDADIDFGVGDFTIVWRGGLVDWTPSSEQQICQKFSGSSPNISGFSLAITALGNIRFYFYRNDDGTIYTTTGENNFSSGSIHTVAVAVTREALGVDGSVRVFIDGQLSETMAITAATAVTLNNSGDLHICGLSSGGQFDQTIQNVYLYNKALTSVEMLGLYRDGVAAADRWGDQTSVTGCLLALEPNNIQPSPSVWMDSSSNRNHARHPQGSSETLHPESRFLIKWVNTWSGTNELQYIGGDNAAVFPAGDIRVDSICCVASAGSVTAQWGDGSSGTYWVAATALSAGFNDLTLAQVNHDGTNRDLTIDPAANYTGTITTIIEGKIL